MNKQLMDGALSQLSGGSKPIHLSPLQWTLLIALVVGGLLGGLTYRSATQHKRLEGPRMDIEAIAQRLGEADRLGDAALAATMFDRITGLLIKLNDAPSADLVRGARHNCKLAAANLAAGIDSVSRGGRWLERDRYEAAVSGCE